VSGNHGRFFFRALRSKDGAALVIALAFVVLLTGLIVAFFSRAMTERLVSNSSANEGRVELFAQGAADQIIGDLKQEIVDGSGTFALAITTGTIYYPASAASAVPAISGFTPAYSSPGVENDGLANLVKCSAWLSGSSVPFYSGTNYVNTGAVRASNILSTGTSLNGRSVSLARWNKALLIQRQNPSSSTDVTPVVAFPAPAWVLVARNGSTPVSSTLSGSMTWSPNNSGAIVGRYAYAIYNEGGLLDMNVAGYPSTSGPTQSAYKNALAYADLTQLQDSLGNSLTAPQWDEVVGWRNYATTQPSGAFPNLTMSATSASAYNSLVLSNPNGFLRTASTALINGQSDRALSSRQQLINLMTQGVPTSSNLATVQNLLAYLGTFSRDINQPSYIPAVQTSASAPVVLATNLGGNSATGGDKLINPSFLYTRVQTSFTRNDGTTANVGDPLVNKRFPLNRLAWITYKGPSATRTQSDADIQALINAGIPWSYLQLGTAVNIQNYFGLTWDANNNRWQYNVHNGGGTGKGIIMLVGRPSGTGASASTYVEDANRDPDFFELLKAGITVGSLGKAAASSASSVSGGSVPSGYAAAQVPVNLRYNFDSSVDYHVIQIGANILSEVNPTSYPARITFNDGSARGTWEFQGATDLPYLGYVFNGVLRTQLPSPAAPNTWADTSPYQYPNPVTGSLTTAGSAYMIQVPAVWNPYDPNGTSGVIRPAQFRVVVDSNDPLSLSGGGGDLSIWHGAEATPRTTSNAYGGSNQGQGLSDGVYSWTVTGLGKTSEVPGTNGTPINDAVTFNDSNGTLYREPTLIFSTTVGGATRTAGNITGIDANPLPGESDGSTGPWAPLVLGQFPLAFASTSGTTTTTYYTGMGLIGLAAGSGDNRIYLTYRLQYQDASGNWVTYDTQYGRTTDGLFSYQCKNNSTRSVIVGNNDFNPYNWAAPIDPRTARFGLFMETMNKQRSASSAVAPPYTGWIFNSSGATTVGITYPIRQDNTGGFYFVDLDGNNVPPGALNNDKNFGLLTSNINNLDVPYPSFSAGWAEPLMPINEGHGESDVWMFAPGLYAQNNPGAPFFNGTTIEPSYYADADGVVRRGAGAYVPVGSNVSASTPVGLPPASIQGYSGETASLITPATATPFTQSQSRPLLLHRPYRTVAELGYVFRDVPWKNLDFFTPESGDAGLLDIFCINETSDPNSLVAGKVNLNTRQAPVLTAIVSGACVDDPKITNATVGSLSPTVANTVATALTARTADATNHGPLQNLSELIGKWKSAGAISPGVTYSTVDAGANSGTDLTSPNYMDGQQSYTGFSGNATVTTNSGEDLSSVFTPTAAGSLIQSLAYVKRLHEAPIRALGSVGQTRVWNLMIDVVAQTGRYPQSATALNQFMVEGEQRYWVHVAIDRLTGRVVDKQVEVVKE
jgi:hypothetical protein